MKKIIVALIFVLILQIKQVNAELIQHNTGLGVMQNNKFQEIILYEDVDTRHPVYQIPFATQEILLSTVKEVESLNLQSQELEQIKKWISLITKDKLYVELSFEELIAPQLLIWELYEAKTKEKLQYQFDVSFLEEIKEMVKKSELKKEIYEYTTTIDTPITIHFLPFLKEKYQIHPIHNSCDVKIEKDAFTLTSDKAGTYEFQVDSTYFHEKVKYYSSPEKDMISVTKSKIPNSEIVLEVKASPRKKYHVTLIPSLYGVVKINQTEYESGNQVTMSYDLKENVLLNGIEVYKKNGESVSLTENTFIMPDEDVYIKLNGEVKKKYKVFPSLSEGVMINTLKEYEKGDLVKLEMALKENYALEELKVTTISGQTIITNDFQFIMPDEDVIVEIDARKEKNIFDISSILGDGIHMNIPNKGKEKATISIQYEIDESFILTDLYIKTKSGNQVPITKDRFTMPNEDIILVAKTEKKAISIPQKYQIHTTPKEGIQLEFPIESLAEQTISITYNLEKDYELIEMSIYDSNGTKIETKNNTFIMPKDNIIIIPVVNKRKKEEKTTYQITVIPAPKVHINIQSNGFEKEKISFSYLLDKGYELLNILIYDTDGNQISHQDNSFIMPNKNVIIVPSFQKIIKYPIYIPKQDTIQINVEEKAYANDLVTLQYKLKENYQLESINVYTIDKEKIKVENNTFVMPKSPVVIEAKTKFDPKAYEIKVEKQKGVHLFFPQDTTEKNSLFGSCQLDQVYHLLELKVFTAKGEMIQGLFFEKPLDKTEKSPIEKLPNEKKEPAKTPKIISVKLPEKNHVSENKEIVKEMIVEENIDASSEVPKKNYQSEILFLVLVFFLFCLLKHSK